MCLSFYYFLLRWSSKCSPFLSLWWFRLCFMCDGHCSLHDWLEIIKFYELHRQQQHLYDLEVYGVCAVRPFRRFLAKCSPSCSAGTSAGTTAPLLLPDNLVTCLLPLYFSSFYVSFSGLFHIVRRPESISDFKGEGEVIMATWSHLKAMAAAAAADFNWSCAETLLQEPFSLSLHRLTKNCNPRKLM